MLVQQSTCLFTLTFHPSQLLHGMQRKLHALCLWHSATLSASGTGVHQQSSFGPRATRPQPTKLSCMCACSIACHVVELHTATLTFSRQGSSVRST
jgi:hypothetical protein